MRVLSFVFLLFFFCGCEHIIEEFDLQNEVIDIQFPVDHSKLKDNTVIFSWKSNPYINTYRLQVSTPNFEFPSRILVDSLLNTNQYRDSLPYDYEYQWRIRGENSQYATEFSTQSFSIQSEDNITDDRITLLSPFEGSQINEERVQFTWESLKKASNYRFQMAYPSFEMPERVVIDSIVTNTNLLVEGIPKNKVYQWRVRGENNFFNTNYTTFSFKYSIAEDISKQLPLISIPVDTLVFQSSKTNFNWLELKGATYYRMQIVSPDFKSSYKIIVDTLLQGLNFEKSLPINKKLQWRIRGENGFFASKYNTNDLRVIDAIDISMNKIKLIAPHNNAIIPATTFKLTWETVEGATRYQVQIAYRHG